MASRSKLTDEAKLELYRVALDNAVAQSKIAAKMAELGYDSRVIGEGKAILAETISAYNRTKTEKDEVNASYLDFLRKKTQLKDAYTIHRKLAKVVFRNDSSAADKLAISGTMPRTYIKWLETIGTFYTVASTDTAIQDKLARLKFSAEDINTAKNLITELVAARAVYIKEKAESQDATQIKNVAFSRIDDWMSDFFAVARIGLEDNPQLLEALGITVKR